MIDEMGGKDHVYFFFCPFFHSSIFDFLGRRRRNNELGRRDNMFANLLTPLFFFSFLSLLTTTLTRHAYFLRCNNGVWFFTSAATLQSTVTREEERGEKKRKRNNASQPAFPSTSETQITLSPFCIRRLFRSCHLVHPCPFSFSLLPFSFPS